MVCLTMTPAMVRALEFVQESDTVSSESNNDNDCSLQQQIVGNPISHGQLVELSRSLKKLKEEVKNDGSMSLPLHGLDQLLQGSRVYVEPPKPKAQPTSEYKALMARLRLEEEARAYERMINPAHSAETFSQRFPNSSHAQLFPASQADIGKDDEVSYADINRQMTLIINIMVSIVACSVAIWLAARHWSTPSRLGLSMGGSSMIGVAEVVVYAGYLRRVKESKEKGKKEVEIKEIIKTWIISGENEGKSKDEAVPSITSSSTESAVRRRKATAK
ncbi:MAG: hypothetical protein Q9164_003275 [Protoblastenia rupestris]